ncbi:D-alanyl-D-alanine carboxypeptidase [Alphaproteobacteria bacterium]|nr:D-alanyl-D-alanine carboxypeptidase [Alphaproteobacteria bacterium]
MIGKFLKRLVCLAAVTSFAWSASAAEILTPARYVYITDFESGKVLFAKDAEAPMKPASMAKIMTVFIVFQRIVDGSLRLDDTFLVSEKAWRKGGSRSFVEVGSRVSVSDLLHGVIVQSGNDAAIVLAEGIAGTEDAFAEEMNYWAEKLGMKQTNFRNATGWPDPDLTTTARDLNILTTELIKRFPVAEHPELYPMFAKKEFTYNNIKQPNRNPLVYGTAGADGLKTGHTEESGYGLVGSAIRNGQRFVMVLNGMDSMKQRSTESRRLMDLMFREYQSYELFKKDQPVDQANVWLGTAPKVDLILDAPLKMVLSRKQRQALEISVQWLDPVPAPIRAGDQIGTLVINLPDEVTNLPLRAAYNVDSLGLFNRIGAAVKYLVFGAPTLQKIVQ